MSFLAEIAAAKQKPLKQTVTRVTNCAGVVHLEQKSVDGSYVRTTENGPGHGQGQGQFMVIDTKPDQQLHHVANGVYIGSQDAAHNLEGLRAEKITHILNCATGVENIAPQEFQYINMELLDLPDTNISSHFQASNTAIHQVLAKQGRVLVHCNAGISRSSTLVLAYLIGVEKRRYDDAYQHLKSVRAAIRPNDGFVRQLISYDAQIHGSSSTATAT